MKEQETQEEQGGTAACERWLTTASPQQPRTCSTRNVTVTMAPVTRNPTGNTAAGGKRSNTTTLAA